MTKPFNAYAHGHGTGDPTPILNTEVDGGTCVQPICTAATLTWTANGNKCSQDLPNQQSANGGTGLDRGLGAGAYSPPDTYTYFGDPGNTYEAAEQGSATTLGGHAYFVCGSNGTWQVQPGATCGIGVCEHFTPGGSTGPCVLGSEAQYDECGNYVGSFNCGAPPPPPSNPSCTPPSVANGTVNADCSITCNSGYTLNGTTCQISYCAPGTLYSSCSLQTYQCKDTLVTYDDCGNECGTGNTTPSNVSSRTWLTPICSNGGQCQYGTTGCLTDTPFSSGVVTGYVCNNADGSATCPAPSYPQ